MNDSTNIISTSQRFSVAIIPTAAMTAVICTAPDHIFVISAPSPCQSPSAPRFAFWSRSSISGSSSCSYSMERVFAIRSCTSALRVTIKPMRSFFAERVFSHIITNSTMVVPMTSQRSGIISAFSAPDCRVIMSMTSFAITVQM